MKEEAMILKQIGEISIKVCFDIVEFSSLFDQEKPGDAKRVFQCNASVLKGLKWFIGAENRDEMTENVSAYQRSCKKYIRHIQQPASSNYGQGKNR